MFEPDMSKIIYGGLDQYGTEPFERQQYGLSGVEGVNLYTCEWRIATTTLTFT